MNWRTMEPRHMSKNKPTGSRNLRAPTGQD